MDNVNAYLDGLATKLDYIRTQCNLVITDAGGTPAQTLYDLPAAIATIIPEPEPDPEPTPDPEEEVEE